MNCIFIGHLTPITEREREQEMAKISSAPPDSAVRPLQPGVLPANPPNSALCPEPPSGGAPELLQAQHQNPVSVPSRHPKAGPTSASPAKISFQQLTLRKWLPSFRSNGRYFRKLAMAERQACMIRWWLGRERCRPAPSFCHSSVLSRARGALNCKRGRGEGVGQDHQAQRSKLISQPFPALLN